MATQAGYEYLLAYKITVPIYDYTVVFCNRAHPNLPPSPTRPYPPLSSTRTFDQMIQAGRSGMTNIPEGATQESLASYIKLAGVAKGSLEELLKDVLAYTRQNKIPIWPKEQVEREVRELREVWEILRKTPTLPNNPNFPDLPASLEKAVNLLLTLLNQTTYLQRKLIDSLNDKHMKEGGFTENLYRKRMEYRNKNLK